jgi:hypothetical protein
MNTIDKNYKKFDEPTYLLFQNGAALLTWDGIHKMIWEDLVVGISKNSPEGQNGECVVSCKLAEPCWSQKYF